MYLSQHSQTAYWFQRGLHSCEGLRQCVVAERSGRWADFNNPTGESDGGREDLLLVLAHLNLCTVSQ
jgi:hypothetical protein